MGIESLKWIGHASFMLEGRGKRVYLDPFKLDGRYGKADGIFVTHPHFDHFSIEDIKKIADDKTEFVVPSECKGKLDYKNVRYVKPFDDGIAGGVHYSTMPSYNTNPTRLDFHQRKFNWVGYVVDFEGTKFYHPGDTDIIDEMSEIKVDVALLPIGGTYTMDVGEAIKAASAIRAKAYVPMHYKMLLHEDGSKKAEKEFSERVEDSVILKEVQKPIYSF